MLIFDQCCQICSSSFKSASLVKKKVSYKEVAKLRSREEKRKISKQVNVSKTQLQKELTVPTPLTGETACINPTIFECVNFPKAYNWIKGYFILQEKRKGLNEAGKENQKSVRLCQREEQRVTPTQTCCKFTIWFHPQEPPTVVPDWNAAACTLQRCQHACLPSHADNQIWLHSAKQKPQNMLGFFCIFKPDPVPALGHMRAVWLCQNNRSACGADTGDVNPSRKNTAKASSPCQGQTYLGLEEFLNEQVKPIHVGLSGDKATSDALLYCASNRHFQGMNK